jgi:hypothetical protein
VPQNRHHYGPRLWLGFAFFSVLIFSVALSFAQKTEVQNIGGGRKLELEYNADGLVIEQRNIAPDGKLEQKVVYKRRPGYFVADQTNTSYFPDGKVSKIVENTYDPCANFLGEFAQAFDESGKQISGHKLTHDPMTNTYVCKDWNVASQSYKLIECPSGEESGGGAEKATKFTYDEVIQHLTAARKSAGQPQMAPPGKSAAAMASPEIGLIVPAEIVPGERVSGSIVTNPADYEGMRAVNVTRVPLALESTGEAATLAGWTVEVPGEKSQPANAPIVFTVPRDGSALNFTFQQAGNSSHSVSKPVNFAASSAKAKKSPKGYEADALCLKGKLCTVRGSFSGDSSKTFAAFEDRPGTVVAETQDAVYLRPSDQSEPGPRPLFIEDGSTLMAFPVAVGEYSLLHGDADLKQGAKLVTFPLLDGPSDIAESAWQVRTYPSSSIEEARKLIPGFKVPKQDREAREKREAHEKGESGQSKEKREEDEKKNGLIVLVVKNLTPEQVSLVGFKEHQMAVYYLTDESFSRGEFKYDLLVEALKPGHFNIQGYVIPFLAPVRGQEFPAKTSSGGK